MEAPIFVHCGLSRNETFCVCVLLGGGGVARCVTGGRRHDPHPEPHPPVPGRVAESGFPKVREYSRMRSQKMRCVLVQSMHRAGGGEGQGVSGCAQDALCACAAFHSRNKRLSIGFVGYLSYLSLLFLSRTKHKPLTVTALTDQSFYLVHCTPTICRMTSSLSLLKHGDALSCHSLFVVVNMFTFVLLSVPVFPPLCFRLVIHRGVDGKPPAFPSFDLIPGFIRVEPESPSGGNAETETGVEASGVGGEWFEWEISLSRCARSREAGGRKREGGGGRGGVAFSRGVHFTMYCNRGGHRLKHRQKGHPVWMRRLVSL